MSTKRRKEGRQEQEEEKEEEEEEEGEDKHAHTQVALPCSPFPPSFPGPNHMSYVPYFKFWNLNFVPSTSTHQNYCVKEVKVQRKFANTWKGYIFKRNSRNLS